MTVEEAVKIQEMFYDWTFSTSHPMHGLSPFHLIYITV